MFGTTMVLERHQTTNA